MSSPRIRSVQGLTDTPAPLPRAVGWAAVGVLAIFTALGVARRLPDRPLLGVLAGLIAVLAGAVGILGPRMALIPGFVVGSVALAVLGNASASYVSWFGICAFAGWCVLSAAPLIAIIYWAAAMFLLLGELVFTSHDPGWTAWLGGTCFSVAGCYFGQREHKLVVALKAAQAQLSQRARAEERNRIARELHDVIAHSLTVSLLHVSAARLAVKDDPADAERALAEAERLGRDSLAEVRHAVGLLRHDGEHDPAAPLPGSTDVPALVDGFRSAGADVRAQIDGDLGALPATVGLATYRILQEALTNATKHAPQARATVHVAVVADAVRLDVDSAGAPGRGLGLGLLGMRERAESLGGTCAAGPGGSGWLVHAELPLEPLPSRP